MQTSCQISLHLFHQAISPLGVYSRGIFCLSEVPALLRGEKYAKSISRKLVEHTLLQLYRRILLQPSRENGVFLYVLS